MDILAQLNDALVLAKPFVPLITLVTIGLMSYATISGTGPLAVPDQVQRKASASDTKRGSAFGAAAEMNTVYTPAEAAGDKSEVSTASDARYAFVKYLTIMMDYAQIFALFSFYNEHYTGDKFTPLVATKVFMIAYTTLVCMDIIKGIIFADVVAKAKTDHLKHLGKDFIHLFTPSGLVEIAKFLLKLAKGEGTIFHFSDKGEQRRGILYHIFYQFRLGYVFAPGLAYLSTYCGTFVLRPIFDTAFVIELGKNISIPVPYLVNNYLIFIAMSFIKDAICMNVLHQMMHRHWYKKHYVHHLPMKEVSNANFAFFDFEDIFLENLISPVILLLLKFLMDPTKTPTIDMFAYTMIHLSDVNSHSLCPYTVGFYFPLLDSKLSPVISHNLHHALNMGHYTIWPLHQLKGIFMYDNREKVNVDGSLAKDWATYNRVFKTDFPEGRSVKVD
mmetsp:Transcript_14005/g.33959  ORF Transcript_14005/g.33959 Transcript_14005/m.33959 type:complete len:445 (-) Transcript_14005:136-1470(-)